MSFLCEVVHPYSQEGGGGPVRITRDGPSIITGRRGLHIGPTHLAPNLFNKTVTCETRGRAPAARQRFDFKPRGGALAKYADAFLKISFACSSSRFSRSSIPDPGFSGCRQARPVAAITPGLTQPNAKSVRRTARFTCNRHQRRGGHYCPPTNGRREIIGPGVGPPDACAWKNAPPECLLFLLTLRDGRSAQHEGPMA